jgi:hypothetical protein
MIVARGLRSGQEHCIFKIFDHSTLLPSYQYQFLLTMKYTLTALALAAVSFAAPAYQAQAPDSFKINSVVSGGSGCPQGSIDVNWTDNGILPICASSKILIPSHHFLDQSSPRPVLSEHAQHILYLRPPNKH